MYSENLAQMIESNKKYTLNAEPHASKGFYNPDQNVYQTMYSYVDHPEHVKSYRYDILNLNRGDVTYLPYDLQSDTAHYLYNVPREQHAHDEKQPTRDIAGKCGTGSCNSGGCSSGSCGDKLFPILDPLFNLREVSKQLILLEDHLFHPGKRCEDCIKKHCLTIEAFLEEAITLDVQMQYIGIISDTLKTFRQTVRDVLKNMKSMDDHKCVETAQKLRLLRKPLCMMSASLC